MRVVICGGPKTGKTTFATRLASRDVGPIGVGLVPVRSTDALIGRRTLSWSDQSAEVAKWMDAEGPWIIEGVRAAHALRKWLSGHSAGAPCDQVVWMRQRLVDAEPAAVRMGAGVDTVMEEILGELKQRGVAVIWMGDGRS